MWVKGVWRFAILDGMGTASGYRGVYPSWKLVDLFAKGTDGLHALYLRLDQSHGAACVPANINEWGECIAGVAPPTICELLQFG
jgi:hypothetical protein